MVFAGCIFSLKVIFKLYLNICFHPPTFCKWMNLKISCKLFELNTYIFKRKYKLRKNMRKSGERLSLHLRTKVGMEMPEREWHAIIPNNKIYKDNPFISSSSLLTPLLEYWRKRWEAYWKKIMLRYFRVPQVHGRFLKQESDFHSDMEIYGRRPVAMI